MKKLFTIALLVVSLATSAQSWDIQEYSFRNLYVTDTAIFSLTDDSWGISKDEGLTWSFNLLTIEDQYNPEWIAFFDEMNGVIGLSNHVDEIYNLETNDGGLSWSTSDNNDLKFSSLGVKHLSGTTFISSSLNSIFLKISNDNGASWNTVEFDDGGNPWITLIQSFNEIAYLTAGQKIYKSTDNGQNWSAVLTKDQTIWTSWFLDNKTGYAISGDCCDETSHTIFKTNDGGSNWSEIQSSLTGPVSSLIFTSTNKGYIVDAENGWILETTNDGSSWTKNTSFNREPYQAIKTQNSFFIYGRDAFRFNPDGSPLEVNKDQTTFKVYPTIAKDFLMFTDTNWISYEIKNIEGKTIQKGNTNSSKIDISRLSKGLFFVEFKDQNLLKTTIKFIKN